MAAPALLLAYSDNPLRAGADLQLLPSDEGTNAILLKPYDDIVWQRTSFFDGIRYAGLSQSGCRLALPGNGRMPAEGEALLSWMLDNETQWRIGSLKELAQWSNDG